MSIFLSLEHYFAPNDDDVGRHGSLSQVNIKSCSLCLQRVSLILNIHAMVNKPRSIYQYSNMAPRLSGQTAIFGVVSFVSKSLLGIERQKKVEKFAILTRKPRSHA